MRWFSRRSSSRKGTAAAQARSSARLSLESLEDRFAPTVNYYGGALLTNVEAQAVYYGNGWNSSATAGQQATLDGFLKYIVNSPYTQALTNAGYGVGSGTASAGVLDPVNLANGSTLQDSQIQAELQSLIDNGTIAAPDANRLYVVYVQPNVIVSQGGANSRQNFLGYHGAFAGHTASGQAIDVHYAVIAYPGGSVGNASNSAAAIDDLTSVASHEVAESMTDPNVNYKTLGWYDPARGEIGDITEQYLVRLNGYLVQEVAGKNDRPLSLTAGVPSQPTGVPSQPTTLTATQVALTLSSSQITEGQTVTLTITVSPSSGSGIPTGVVTLMDGNHILGKGNLDANGQLVVTLFANPGSAGTHSFTAVYEGDSSFQGSTSSATTLTVQPSTTPIWQLVWWHHRRYRY